MFPDTLDDALSLAPVEGAEFEQAIPPLVQLPLAFRAKRDRILDQRVLLARVRRAACTLCEAEHAVTKLFRVLLAARQRTRKRVHAAMIPVRNQLQRTCLHDRHMDLDGLRLTDAIKPPDALLDHGGIQGQVEEHEVMRELEIASLAPDLRTNHQLR